MSETPVQAPVVATFEARQTMEGAGVRLKRAFGFSEVPQLDPFLLLDTFRSDDPEDYRRGFPSHPHRGIETITYVLDGEVEHGDSMGNRGLIGPGDVQWMTAGSGIVHQEMPKGDGRGRMAGFQLWANLPAANKMMSPRYQEVRAAQVPTAKLANGARVRVVAGEVAAPDGPVRGPVHEIVTEPTLIDVTLPAHATFEQPLGRGRSGFAFVFEGSARFGADERAPLRATDALVVFGEGDSIHATSGPSGARFLLAEGRPLREPVAWAGPIVMNTRDELRQAFHELEEGTFVRARET